MPFSIDMSIGIIPLIISYIVIYHITVLRIFVVCLMEEIDLFLDKVRLSDYKDKFIETVTDVREFQGLLSDQESLKQQIGLSNLEVKRFVRLCESTLNVSIFHTFCLC